MRDRLRGREREMTETYHLGIDVGTSRVAAATARLTQDGSVLATQVALGRRSDHIPAVVFVTAEGELLFGDTAERRGLTPSLSGSSASSGGVWATRCPCSSQGTD